MPPLAHVPNVRYSAVEAQTFSRLSAAFIQGVGVAGQASIKKALNRLVQLKVIYWHEGEYKFVNPFFKSWLLWKNY